MQSHAELKKEIKELKSDLEAVRKDYRKASGDAGGCMKLLQDAEEDFRREKAIVNHLIEY